MGLREKAKTALKLKADYLHLYERENLEDGRKIELEYLQIRKEILEEIDSDISRQRSIPMRDIIKRVSQKVKPKRIETGIYNLDMELVTEQMYAARIKGGLALGNFIQIAGSKGSGKSSIMLKMITGFSNYEQVSWFDFEMGEDRVVEKLRDFVFNEDNMLYYNSSRSLNEVIDEIKVLNASGVNHFVIDSAMKITVSGADRYEKFSTISGELSSLTSTLGINIYMINQLSQSSEREGHLMIKHGNDAEYDADFIFFILKRPLLENGENVKDEHGMDLMDENIRILKCTKNRQDERLFTIEIPKYQIVNIAPETVEYEEA